MAIERWGALSVADHNDLPALVANVMLYDRLVMPMYTEADDRDEQAYWQAHQWHPELQAKRRQQLGELVIECAWDQQRRQSYQSRYQAALQMDAEANGEDITRWLLTEESEYQLPSGVHHADVFVAYNSMAKAQDDLATKQVEPMGLGEDEKVAVLISHDIGIPNIAEPEVALTETIALARESEFKQKRADLYDFQMSCLHRGMSAKAIVAELKDRNTELIEYLKQQKFPLYKKTGFLLAGTTLALAAGAFAEPLGAVGGLLSLWQFAALDSTPDYRLSHRLLPVAAYHDMKNLLEKNQS